MLEEGNGSIFRLRQFCKCILVKYPSLFQKYWTNICIMNIESHKSKTTNFQAQISILRNNSQLTNCSISVNDGVAAEAILGPCIVR